LPIVGGTDIRLPLDTNSAQYWQNITYGEYSPMTE